MNKVRNEISNLSQSSCCSIDKSKNIVSISGGAMGGNAAQWELTPRAGEEKPFQGQHGNITFRRYTTAMRCGEAMPEQEPNQKNSGRTTVKYTYSIEPFPKHLTSSHGVR